MAAASRCEAACEPAASERRAGEVVSARPGTAQARHGIWGTPQRAAPAPHLDTPRDGGSKGRLPVQAGRPLIVGVVRRTVPWHGKSCQGPHWESGPFYPRAAGSLAGGRGCRAARTPPLLPALAASSSTPHAVSTVPGRGASHA